jgi:hypothetical protein
MRTTPSPHDYWTLQGIERGLLAGDRRLATEFAEFSGSRRSVLRRVIAEVVDYAHGRSIAGRRRSTVALIVLLAVEALFTAGVIVGSHWLILAGMATITLTVSVASGVALVGGPPSGR